MSRSSCPPLPRDDRWVTETPSETPAAVSCRVRPECRSAAPASFPRNECSPLSAWSRHGPGRYPKVGCNRAFDFRPGAPAASARIHPREKARRISGRRCVRGDGIRSTRRQRAATRSGKSAPLTPSRSRNRPDSCRERRCGAGAVTRVRSRSGACSGRPWRRRRRGDR
jgi:hypothetical protein